jgi:cytoskeletal protein CcmA (bactofilin family)
MALQSSIPAPATTASPESAARLIVGPHIKLKGLEITDCDTLLVEGSVEATMKSRVIEIAEIGAFKGEAEIDTADIRGRFEGKLTVRHKLLIHATGRVTGTVRYGSLVIEEGGQLCGEVQVATAAGTADSAQALARVA